MQSKRRRLSDLASVAAIRRSLDGHRIALVALITVAAFAVVYLITANVVLRTRLLRDLLGAGPDVELEYASAYSVWPGRVHVRGLSLAVQDYGYQFSVVADSGVLKISLHELLLRRFHATEVVLSGLSFRLRQKVPEANVGSPRVLAYPSIIGFGDPPVRIGEKPPPISDAEYDLWQIALDDVRAEIRELWLMEYRYLGGGRIARGGFHVQPARSFAVYPAQVTLSHGVLSVGDNVAVQRLELDVQAHIDTTDVRQVEGAKLAEQVSGNVSLDARGLNFAAFDLRERREQRPRVRGSADLSLEASLSAGRLEPGGTAELTAGHVSVDCPLGKLSGSLSSSLKTLAGGRVEWQTSSHKFSLAGSSQQRGPTFGAPTLNLVLQSETLATPPSLSRLEFDVPQLSVPSLRWARRWVAGAGLPLEIGGRLEGRAHLSYAPEQGPAGRLRLRLADAELSTDSVRAALGGRIEAVLQPVAGRGANSTGRLDIELEGVEVERVRERTKPFRAAVRLPDLKVTLEPELALSATVDVSANPADSLLSVALGSPMLEDLAADVFDLRRLEARARLSVSRRAVRFELARAVSGGLEGTGFWQRPAAGGARGAFLISSKVANVGISLVGSDTETAWFVPDDWLASGKRQAPEKRQAGEKRRERGSQAARPSAAGRR